MVETPKNDDDDDDDEFCAYKSEAAILSRGSSRVDWLQHSSN
jgi:hypothetical protein